MTPPPPVRCSSGKRNDSTYSEKIPGTTLLLRHEKLCCDLLQHIYREYHAPVVILFYYHTYIDFARPIGVS